MKRILFLAMTTVCAWGIPAHYEFAQDSNGADSTPKIHVETLDLTLHPKAESAPVLKYKFLPDSFERNESNAAILYLKAEGFLEQNSARKKLQEVYMEAAAKAEADKVDVGQVAPYSYLEMEPSKYPINEVKEYLQYTAFQPRLLEQAWLSDRFVMERQVKNSKNPFSILLPEIQSIRELARTQSIRCRLAIAENRIDDAMKILGQQYAMARHLGQDDFLVSALVGVAVQSIATRDLYYLLQHPDCPNLFWAASQLPKPLIDWEHCLSSEYHWVELQFAMLREVNTQPKSREYWQQFMDEFADEMKSHGVFYWSGNEMGDESKLSANPRQEIEGHVSSSYESAKQYLVQRSIVREERIGSYPEAQVFFLAMKHHFAEARDELFKWMYVAPHVGNQTLESLEKKNADRNQPAFTRLSDFLIAGKAVRSVQARSLQGILLIQAVEDIRLYGAAHDNKLPESLTELPYPLPVDPASGEPLLYSKKGDTATITASPVGNLQRVLNIRLVEPTK